MSVSGTPVTTYDDGFPKAHPSLPPSTRRSGRGVVHRRPLVEYRRSRPNSSPRVIDPTSSTAERAGGVGGALGNPSSYVLTGVPATDRRAVGQTVRSGFPRPHRPTRPVDRRRLGRHSFELRHYAGAIHFGPRPRPDCRYDRGEHGGAAMPEATVIRLAETKPIPFG